MMAQSKKRVQKRIGRPCPECGGVMFIVLKISTHHGVEYSQKFMECSDCDYEKSMDSNKHKFDHKDIELPE